MTNVRVGYEAYRADRSGARTSAPQRSLRMTVRAAWRRHRDLISNAGSLVATTGVASALGFFYWALAAQLFSQRAVGYGSAAVSAMTLLGTIGMFGLGTVLIGELPRRRPRAGLVSAALLASGLGSMVLGLGFAVVASSLSARFAHISGGPGQAALFAVGVMVTGASLVFDQATIGLMRGGLQLSRNVSFAVAKLLALPATTIILHDRFGLGITVSWVAGTAVSLVPVAIRLRLTGTPVLPRPDWGVLRGLGRTAIAHSWLNIAITVPWSLIPVLVTVVVSPSANAAFYVAWMLTSFLYIVPGSLSTVLFAVAAADPQVIARKLRFTLRLSLLIGLPGMAVLILGGHMALSLFGAGYARAATFPLTLLAISYLPAIPKIHYVAVCRARGKIPRAAAVLTAAAASEVTAAALGGISGGLKGLSFALLGVYIVEGLVTGPAVVRAAIGSGRHRRAISLGVSSDPATSAVLSDESYRDRQEAGIAVLLSLAVPTASPMLYAAQSLGYSGQTATSIWERHTAVSGRPAPPT
jgi:O-antigen/teichoic acid export membrane protein